MSNPDLLQPTLQSLNISLSSIADLLSNGTLSIGTTTGQVPIGGIALAAGSGLVANAAASASFAAVSGLTNYLTGFDVNSTGSNAALVTQVLITGLTGGSMAFTYLSVAGATTLNAPLSIRFPGPIPASASNTAITVTLGALGAGNAGATVSLYGYSV